MASRTWFFFLVVVLLLNLCHGNETKEEEIKDKTTPPEDDNVIVLSKDNFDDYTKNTKLVLVEFYAPWCGHCQALAPQYSKAALALKKNDPPVPLAKINCDEEKDLCNNNGVSGYPTLKLYKDGEASDYDGPRDTAGIVNFMKERSDPNWKPPPDSVITLTEKNFDEITKNEELMLVEFYAPWCGHCKKLAPELEKAAKVLEKLEIPIKIGKVDATVEKELAERHKVDGYPTMFLVRKGNFNGYQGPRNEPGISNYMISQQGDPSHLYKTLLDVKNFIKKPTYDDPSILAVVSSKDDPMYQLYVNANNDVREDYDFGHTFSEDAKTYFALKKSAIMVIHPEHIRTKHEPKYHIFDDVDGSPSEVLEFYKKARCPLVGHFTSLNEKLYSKRPLVMVFYDVNFAPAVRSLTEFWRAKVVNVAKNHPDMLFTVVNEESFEDRLKELGLSESGEDVNVGIYDDQGRRYALVDEEFSEDSLEEFVQDFKKGKLKPIIKSQPPAQKAKPGKVQVVTGKTFDEIVLDESKEVFIEFYAPWCGHCKAIEGYIDNLAKKYKDEKDIIIAKMDGTENEAPKQYSFSGFPTIYYALPGKKMEPILLDGKRDMEALAQFVENNSVVLKSKKKSDAPANDKKEEL